MIKEKTAAYLFMELAGNILSFYNNKTVILAPITLILFLLILRLIFSKSNK